MGFIGYEIMEILSFLKREEKVYMDVLRDSPEGGLICETVNGKTHYLHSVPAGKNASGKRVYKRTWIMSDTEMMHALVDKEYAKSALKIITRDIDILEKAWTRMVEVTPEVIRSGMRRSYQRLPEVWLPEMRRAGAAKTGQREWAEQPYEQSTYRPEDKIHVTSRGLRVRSRAELLIAELLYKFDIPFRYEQVIRVGKYELVPDFTFLDRNGKEFYLEYCGKMGDPEYVKRLLWKRNLYEGIGLNEWTNMIYIFNAGDGIDLQEIEAVIRTKILTRLQISTSEQVRLYPSD